MQQAENEGNRIDSKNIANDISEVYLVGQIVLDKTERIEKNK